MTKPSPEVITYATINGFRWFAQAINRDFRPTSHVQFLIRTGEYTIARKAGR